MAPRIARRRKNVRFVSLRFLELGRHVLRQPIGAERAKKGIAGPMRKATEDTVDLHFALSRSIWTKLHTETYIARIPPCSHLPLTLLKSLPAVAIRAGWTTGSELGTSWARGRHGAARTSRHRGLGAERGRRRAPGQPPGLA